MPPPFESFSTLHAPRPQHSRHASQTRSQRPSRDTSPHVYKTPSRVPSKDALSAPIPALRASSRPSTPTHPTSPRRTRSSWPPSPFVEEERRSRARERSPPLVLDPAIAEVKCRGTPDQVPTVIDTRLPVDSADTLQAESRESGEIAEEQRRHRGLGIDKGNDERPPPGFEQRRPARYAHVTASANDETTTNLRQHRSNESLHSNALRGEGKTRRSFSRGSSDMSSPKEFQNDKSRDARASLPPAAKLKVQEAFQARRAAAEGHLAAQRPPLDLRKGASVMAGIALDPSQFVSSPTSTSSPWDYTGQRKGSESDNSRPTTPDRSRPRHPYSPPRSPHRSSGRRSPDSSRRSSNASQPASRPSSRPSSRASSPQRGLDRTQRTSKLMSSMTPSTADLKTGDSRPTSRHGPASPTPPGSSLPYPIDDMALMPSEVDHRYRPRSLKSTDIPGFPSPASTGSPSTPGGSLASPTRPGMTRARTHDIDLPRLTMPAFGIAGHMLTPTTPSSARPVTPPTCLGTKPVKGLRDWHTLEDSPRFNICRPCIDLHVTGTPFEGQFRRVSRDPERRFGCDFASPWARLAWQLDQKRGRGDLRHLRTVADILAAEVPCPGVYEGRTVWYTLADEHGNEIKEFHVCATDVKLIRALLPRASKVFERHEQHKNSLRKCDLNSESRRFKQYLELLEEVEHEARAGDKGQGLAKHRFHQHVQRKLEHPECLRDEPIENVRWHYIPGLPEFTVCRECYSDVVWPQIAAGSRVALNFNQTPSRMVQKRAQMPLAAGVHDLQTCQLYSARMRDVFRKACEKNDFAMLERKARRRKEEELGIRADAEAARRELQALKKQGAGEASVAQAQHHLAEVEAVWKKWE